MRTTQAGAPDGAQDRAYGTVDAPVGGHATHGASTRPPRQHDHAVRVAVVDSRFFATAIHAHSDAAHIDWRSDYDALTYEPIEIPADVRRRVRALMDRLGLRFGALDLLIRADGAHVFLEINPNGQWAWIEQTAPAIASAIADALTERRPSE